MALIVSSMPVTRPFPAGVLAASASRPPQPRRGVLCRSAGFDNPIFSDQFKSVLRDSLQRQGNDAILGGSRPEEPRESATIEVLTQALAQSKQTLAFMVQLRDQLDRQIATQQKQVERVDFALNKARNDAAYMNALKEMLHES